MGAPGAVPSPGDITAAPSRRPGLAPSSPGLGGTTLGQSPVAVSFSQHRAALAPRYQQQTPPFLLRTAAKRAHGRIQPGSTEPSTSPPGSRRCSGRRKRMAPCVGRQSSRSERWRLISPLPCLSFPSFCCPSRGAALPVLGDSARRCLPRGTGNAIPGARAGGIAPASPGCLQLSPLRFIPRPFLSAPAHTWSETNATRGRVTFHHSTRLVTGKPCLLHPSP